MKTDSRREVSVMVGKLLTLHGRPADAAVIRLWVEALADLDLGELRAAFGRAMRETERMPAPGTLRRYCAEAGKARQESLFELHSRLPLARIELDEARTRGGDVERAEGVLAQLMARIDAAHGGQRRLSS